MESISISVLEWIFRCLVYTLSGGSSLAIWWSLTHTVSDSFWFPAHSLPHIFGCSHCICGRFNCRPWQLPQTAAGHWLLPSWEFFVHNDYVFLNKISWSFFRNVGRRSAWWCCQMCGSLFVSVISLSVVAVFPKKITELQTFLSFKFTWLGILCLLSMISSERKVF